MALPLVYARHKDSLANITEATFFMENGNRYTKFTSPLTRTLNTTILELFRRIHKRAIYSWRAHVKCTETLDWQLEVDKKHKFFSKDFEADGKFARKKMKHMIDVFTKQSVFQFKPMMLVRLDSGTPGFKTINYDRHMRDLILNHPLLLEQWNHQIHLLSQEREMLLVPMRAKVNKQNQQTNLRMIEPGYAHYLDIIETMHGFNEHGDIMCVSSRREEYAWNSISQLFVECSMLAQRNGLDKFTKHADWQITINGEYSFDEIDYRDCEPGCMPPVMADYPHVFTPQFTIVMSPVFLVHHYDEMQQLMCMNLLCFIDLMHQKWTAHEEEKMEQFIFAEFSMLPKNMANVSLDPGINKMIFDAVVMPNNTASLTAYYGSR
jgi:hypothetical protein